MQALWKHVKCQSEDGEGALLENDPKTRLQWRVEGSRSVRRKTQVA